MGQSKKTAIQPTRSQDYPKWYQEVIKAADMAENSSTRGCMVIKPWGYGIWELIQANLDRRFKDTGHENAYFPLLIPLGHLEKEAQHVEGFAKECAVVTHHRLAQDPNDASKLIPASPLEEPMVIRPTSETIIGESFAKWVQSYRDLPLLINQWANVFRWEMRTRLFLRTAEFLWQEGHTAHAREEEALEETMQMLEVYREFAETEMALPMISGEKTVDERFPGAVSTFSIEGMMQDGKALQCGTSHFLGQNFSKACGIKFLNKNEKEEFAWTTSWGVSTRLIGGLIMTHSDDDGLRLPPRIAPDQVVIIAIGKSDEDRERVKSACEDLKRKLKSLNVFGSNLRVRIDARDMGPGARSWEWIKKGVPVRIEIGPKDLEKSGGMLNDRLSDPKSKAFVSWEEMMSVVPAKLEHVQSTLLSEAKASLESRTVQFETFEESLEFFKKGDQSPTENGGFAKMYLADDEAVLEKLKPHKLTARCIPMESANERGTCVLSGNSDGRLMIVAKSY